MKNDQRTEKGPMRADDVFFDALEFETIEEREAFLGKTCADNQALRQEVDQLFDSLDAAEEFFADATLLEILAEDLLEALSNHLELTDRIESALPNDDLACN